MIKHSFTVFLTRGLNLQLILLELFSTMLFEKLLEHIAEFVVSDRSGSERFQTGPSVRVKIDQTFL